MVKDKGPKNIDTGVDSKVEMGNAISTGSWAPTDRPVLVVSNHQALRDLLQSGFGDLGYQVRCAAGSLEALKILKSQNIELLVIESMLDGESCGEFLGLIENLKKAESLAALIVCEDFNDPGLADLNVPVKTACIIKTNLSKEILRQSGQQLLDPNYDPEVEKRKLNGRVLVCESIEERLDNLKDYLLQSGLDVVISRTKEEGLSKARATMPDVIIVGADVVGGGAIEFVTSVKSDRALESIPCLVLCDEQSRLRVRSGAFSAGSLGSVMFPIIKEELLAQVGVMAKLTQTIATMQENAVSLAVSNFELSETRSLLEEKTKQLEKSSTFKSEFLAKMSHELRTPLTGMLGFAQRLLEMSPSDPNHKDAVSTIMRNGDHLLELINDILDLSKIEAGKLDITLQSTSPVDVLHDVKALMQIRAEQKGIALSIEALDDIPEKIVSDPMRLKQIILNLVGNAIKFTQRGSVRVVLSCNKDQETMQFQVIDTGMGMSAEAKDRLFQAFVQGDTDVTRKFGGTGLGLTISLQLAQMLGGSISVDSILGMGSSFKVVIKTGSLEGIGFLSPADIDRARSKALDARNFESIKLAGRVLIAEDNADSRKVLEYYIKKAGAEIIFVDNGMDAVNRAISDSPDLVMMDMQMPIMDGYDATRKLRGQGFTKPVIAITANALSSEIKKCMDAGCSHAQPKPFNWPSLFGLLNEFIGIGTVTALSAAPVVTPAKVSAPEKASAPAKSVSQAPVAVAPVAKPAETVSRDSLSIEARVEELKAEEDESAPLISELYEEAVDLRPIIVDFVKGLDPYKLAIRNATKSKDWAGLKQTAHDLSGISGMYGYPDTSEIAKRLRLACMQRNVDEIRGLSSELLTLIDLMKSGLVKMTSSQVAPIESGETAVIISDLITLSPDLIPQVVEFIDNLGSVVAKIHRAYKSSNWKELKDVSNEAAGTALLYGYPKLAEVNQQIEEAAKDRDTMIVGEKMKELHAIKEAILRGRDQISS
jgi:signal transduction histidine kinase/HPt (histidine-containing phosphotransfer) domain-containing protein